MLSFVWQPIGWWSGKHSLLKVLDIANAVQSGTVWVFDVASCPETHKRFSVWFLDPHVAVLETFDSMAGGVLQWDLWDSFAVLPPRCWSMCDLLLASECSRSLPFSCFTADTFRWVRKMWLGTEVRATKLMSLIPKGSSLSTDGAKCYDPLVKELPSKKINLKKVVHVKNQYVKKLRPQKAKQMRRAGTQALDSSWRFLKKWKCSAGQKLTLQESLFWTISSIGRLGQSFFTWNVMKLYNYANVSFLSLTYE